MVGIEDTVFTILDLETAGFERGPNARICEIGAIKQKNGADQERVSMLIHPGRPIDPDVIKIHRITDDMVKDAPKFADVAAKISKFVKGTVIVAHNTGFDIPILNSELARAGAPLFRGGSIDTIRLARKAFPGLPSYGLDNLARHFGITFSQRHRSMSDCEATVHIFWKCVRRLRQSGKVRTLLDLLEAGRNKSLERVV